LPREENKLDHPRHTPQAVDSDVQDRMFLSAQSTILFQPLLHAHDPDKVMADRIVKHQSEDRKKKNTESKIWNSFAQAMLLDVSRKPKIEEWETNDLLEH